MSRLFFIICFVLCYAPLKAQVSSAYTSYFTGNDNDVQTSPTGGVCMMGGSVEDDDAMRWFLQRANGGDILVLRASGAAGYNNYFYSELGVTVNSVETIVCHNASCADEAYIHQKIAQAEAIWFAGGDQWRYVSYWRGTKIDSLINVAISERNVVIGGTSAGMAILGGFYFTAQNNTITSAAALANPFNSSLTVDSVQFIQSSPYLKEVITDTHYDNPDRKGRHVAFLARIFNDYATAAKGIACNERTAVCVSPDGIARVFGRFPQNQNHEAFFIQVNCEEANNGPETIQNGQALTWNRDGKALKVYRVKGNPEGSNTFNLNDWKTGSGGTWEHWAVNVGMLGIEEGTAPNCTLTSLDALDKQRGGALFYPNPAGDHVHFSEYGVKKAVAIDALGKMYALKFEENGDVTISLKNLPKHQPLIVFVYTEQKVHKVRLIRF
jgi:cyanophycinase-like exopeptidase